jgi:AcrR family transcriptional regulator
MPALANPVPVRRLGGRSASVRRDVLAAAVQTLAERGVAGLTVEEVAARAGVNKTTIYRRWPTVHALAADAVSDVLELAVPIPDTGSLRDDLRRVLREANAFVISPIGQALVHASVGAPDTAAIAESLQAVWAKRFALLAAIVDRAVARGELPPITDSRFLLEQLAAPLYFRLFIVRAKVDRHYLDRVVDHTIAAARSSRAEEPRRKERG